MAKLLDTEYPLPSYLDGWDAHDEAFEAIPADRIFSYPHADGYANYYIVSEKPLILQHIPYGDAWQLPYAHIRGLRLSDINLHRQMTNLFK